MSRAAFPRRWFPPVPLVLPLPCRGRVGVGVAALRGTSIRTPLPTSPLSGGRSIWWSGGRREGYRWAGGVDGSLLSRLFLPLPCRGRVGVGVAALRGISIRTPLPTSPLSGGRSIWWSGGRNIDGQGCRWFPPVPFISPSPLQGEGRGGGRGVAGHVHPDPPPDLPPVRGEGYLVVRGRSVDGQGVSMVVPSCPSCSPSPLQGEGRGGGRGVAAHVHPDPPPDLPLSGGRSI